MKHPDDWKAEWEKMEDEGVELDIRDFLAEVQKDAYEQEVRDVKTQFQAARPLTR